MDILSMCRLDEDVPGESTYFTIETLKTYHEKHKGEFVPWIPFMADKAIGSRQVVNSVLNNDDFGLDGGRWRLMDMLSVAAFPWVVRSMDSVSDQYRENDWYGARREYIKT